MPERPFMNRKIENPILRALLPLLDDSKIIISYGDSTAVERPDEYWWEDDDTLEDDSLDYPALGDYEGTVTILHEVEPEPMDWLSDDFDGDDEQLAKRAHTYARGLKIR